MEKYANEMSHRIETVGRNTKKVFFSKKKGFRVHENPVILYFCRCSNQIAAYSSLVRKIGKKTNEIESKRTAKYIDGK